MLRLPFLLILLLSICACGQKGQVTETKFVISGVTPTTAADLVNGAMLMTAFNTTTQQILRVKMSQSNQAFSLPNGRWFFSVVYWNNTDPELATTLRCGVTTQELIGEDVAINITITATGCANANVNAAKFYDGFALQNIELNQCSNISNPGSNCTTVPGIAASAKFTFPAIDLSDISNPTYNPTAGVVISGCINLSSGTANIASLIPGGSTNVPFPFTIRTYSSAGCTGGQAIFNFNNGLLTSDSAGQRVVDVTASNPDITRIMLLTDTSFASSVATLNVPAESAYPVNLAPFISGGTPPYTFMMSPAIGTLSSSGLFTPGNTTTTYTVTVRDAAAAEINFTMQTHPKVTHTHFFDFFLGNWDTYRDSVGVTMPSASMYDTAPIDDPRFFRTTALDRYLLTERAATNYVLHSSALNQTGWIHNATASTPSSDPINGGIVSVLQKTSSTTSFASQTISHPSGGTNFVSAHFKAGTSSYAAMTSTNGINCHGVHINLSTGALNRLSFSGCSGSFLMGEFGAINVGNGWWRVWFKQPNTSTTSDIKVYPAWGSSPNSEALGGATMGLNLRVYNVQVEQSTVPSTPIESGATAGTRASEYHQNTLDAGAVSYTQGTVLFDYHPIVPSNQSFPLLSFCNGATTNLEISRNGSGFPALRLFNGGSNNTVTGVVAESVSNNRLVGSFGSSSLKLAMRGQSVTSVARTMFPGTTTDLNIGRDCLGTTNQTVGVRRMGYWNVEFHELIMQQMANGSN